MEKILATMMIEILGKPKAHVTEALQSVVTRMGSENGVSVTSKIYHEPVLVEGSKELFTAFAEVEVELDSLNNYFQILFSYLPSHIEIIHPERLNFSNADFNDLGNAIINRLHGYDAVTKNAVMEKEILLKRLQEVAPHLFSKLPKQINPTNLKKSEGSLSSQKKSNSAKKNKKKKKSG